MFQYLYANATTRGTRRRCHRQRHKKDTEKESRFRLHSQERKKGQGLYQKRVKAGLLNQLQPLELYAAASDLREVVLSLLHKPALLCAAENLRQPHGHFRRYAAHLVDEFRKRVARHSKGLRFSRDGQA